jgi:Major Facilitator Superfamily/Cyclic nucleotide-binding domain
MSAGWRQVSISLRALASVFKNPSLARLSLAWAGMTFTTWAFAIALGVYAFGQGGATAVGIAALVRVLPGAFASPLAGLLADQRSRRLVLTWSALLSGLAIALSAVSVAMDAPTWIVYGLAGVFTVASTAYVPAEGALLPLVARTPQELSAANVARNQMDSAGFLCASLMTGVLLAVASPEAAFAAAGAAGLITALVLATLTKDQRPSYEEEERSGLLRQTAVGFRTLMSDPKLRLPGIALTLLVFIEGAADVMVVIVTLDLLGLGEGNIGWINACWGIGAMAAGAGLAVLLDRGNLAAGLSVGCLIAGAGFALPGAWPAGVAVYLSFLLLGAGYSCVEVAARTLLQRLGSDETLASTLGFLETSRFAAMGLGAIAAPALVAILGVRGALLAFAALLPAFALLRWNALRSYEIGAPVSERNYNLLRGTSIFAPLPVDTLEGVCRSLVSVDAAQGADVVTQGDVGHRFYLIEAGEVEVIKDDQFKCNQSDGDCFGEIALLRNVPRTATVRTVRQTKLLVLERDDFLETVTGHRRSHQSADEVIGNWLET